MECSRGQIDLTDPLVAQEPQGHLAHLTGAQHQHTPAGEAAKDVLCSRHRGVAYRNRAPSEPGFVANALGSSQRPSDDDLKVDVEGAGLPGPGQRSLELAEHLRLADHQGVEAAGNEKQMSHRIVAREPIREAPPGFERQLMRP